MTQKALIVDDDPLVRNLIATLLRRKGMIAVQAADGDEAIALLTQSQPVLPDAHDFDLILLDLMMARTSGWDVLRHIKSQMPELLPHVVVVSASGDLGARDVERVGCGAILPKPFDAEELYRIVGKCLRGPHGLPNTTLPVLALFCSLGLAAM